MEWIATSPCGLLAMTKTGHVIASEAKQSIVIKMKEIPKLFFPDSDILNKVAGGKLPVQRGKIMEQKKTLWIIAAVGVFLLVVLGVPAILHYPSRNPVPAYASISPVEKKTSQGGWTKPAAEVEATKGLPQDLSATKVNELVVLADNATVYSQNTEVQSNQATTIDLNALKNNLVTDSQLQAQNQPQNINITVNVPDTKEEVKVSPKAEVQTVVKADTANSVKTVQKAETKAAKSTKTVAQANANTSSKNAAPAPKAEPKKTQYWVQVAAYSNKKGAEGARTILDENKIPSDIFTYRDNKDKLYYRVRVGPYTTKSEAEYWRTRIIKISEIDNANDSYITSTTI